MDAQQRIKDQVTGNPVVLYMKGTPQMPQCGFSAMAVQVLQACGVTQFASVNVLAVVERVAYRSGALRMFGQVCRPAGPGPFPLVALSDDGVAGLSDPRTGACAEAARRGRVQIEPAFRGQYGSGGYVQLCEGEVDDLIHMLEIAAQLPQVDRARVALWGEGFGGCVTARALQRRGWRDAPGGVQSRAAAIASGVSALGDLYAFWQRRVADGIGFRSSRTGI